MTTKTRLAKATAAALHAGHQHIRISEVYLLSGRVHRKVLVERFARAATAIRESLDSSGVDVDTLDPSDRGILQSVLWMGTNPAKGTYYEQAVRASANLADHLAVSNKECPR
jgi:hypothetical protein